MKRQRYWFDQLEMGVYVYHLTVQLYAHWQLTVYINLPVCLFASIVLVASLRKVYLQGPPSASWKMFFRKFDFVGL